MFSSPPQTREALASIGYITDDITATVVYLGAKLNKPVLLEGPPGSGKTELAYAIAKATGTEVERLQCFEGINEEKAIGKFDEALQRLAVELRSKSGPVEWEQLKQELHGLEFFSAGPLLLALQYPKRCVLLIDELDIDWGLGVAPGTRLRARLESAVSTGSLPPSRYWLVTADCTSTAWHAG